jgi:ABC-type transport system involved in cytochrome c biogenesis ATPase subunit
LDLEALAENRETKCLSSFIFASFLALSLCIFYGIGKTTLLRTLVGELEADKGKIKWSENVNIGYYAQDHSADFEEDMSVLDWMAQYP